MKLNKPFIFVIFLTITFMFSALLPEEVLARGMGGFRGGGRAFRSSRSASWKTSSARQKSAWSSSKSRRMASQRGTVGKSRSRAASKADKALYRKAKANRTVFKSRADARKAFQAKHGEKFGSSYATKPNMRPDHIPQTTNVKGKNYPVTYSPQYGGYGYYGSSGRWILYSAMADVTMMSMLMNRHHYYYGAPPVAYGGFGGSFFSGFLIIVIIIVLAILMRPRL